MLAVFHLLPRRVVIPRSLRCWGDETEPMVLTGVQAEDQLDDRGFLLVNRQPSVRSDAVAEQRLGPMPGRATPDRASTL